MIPPLLYFQASDGQGESEQQSQGQEILGGHTQTTRRACEINRIIENK